MSDFIRKATGSATLPDGGAKVSEVIHASAIFTASPVVSYEKRPNGLWVVTWKNGENESFSLVGELDEGSNPTADGKGMTSNGFTIEVNFEKRKKEEEKK